MRCLLKLALKKLRRKQLIALIKSIYFQQRTVRQEQLWLRHAIQMKSFAQKTPLNHLLDYYIEKALESIFKPDLQDLAP